VILIDANISLSARVTVGTGLQVYGRPRVDRERKSPFPIERVEPRLHAQPGAYERLTLQSDDWFIDAEIMIQARLLGFRIGEVETEFLGLAGRRSFVRMSAVVELRVSPVFPSAAST
jgi:hypothetical protein